MNIRNTEYSGKAYQVLNGTFYHVDTSIEVIGILEQARQESVAIVVHYGNAETGKDWEEVYDVSGKIGRSIGPVKVPLLIYNSRSLGGPSILDHCIVKIVTRKGKRQLYCHERYHIGVNHED